MKKFFEEIRNLDNEINNEKLYNFINDFDKTMNKKLKRILIKIIILLATIISGCSLIVLSSNPIMIAVSTIIISTGILVNKRIDQENIKSNKNEKILKLNKEKEMEDVLENGLGKNIEQYYTNSYKEVLEKRKYDYHSKTIPKEEIQLNKNETMIQITSEIESFYNSYKLPPFKIDEQEWNQLFSKIYLLCFQKNIQQFFYDIMSTLIRTSIAKILVNEKKSIKLIDITENLFYLKKYEITNEEIEMLKKDIMAKENINTIIEYEKYAEQKKKQKIKKEGLNHGKNN